MLGIIYTDEVLTDGLRRDESASGQRNGRGFAPATFVREVRPISCGL
jgi:hypothetical protein